MEPNETELFESYAAQEMEMIRDEIIAGLSPIERAALDQDLDLFIERVRAQMSMDHGEFDYDNQEDI